MYDSQNAELENLDKLFEKLSEGQTPNFLEMMAAISEVSTLWPENDNSEQDTLCRFGQCG